MARGGIENYPRGFGGERVPQYLRDIPDRDYIILPGDQMSFTEQGRLIENTAFASSLLPKWLKGDTQNSAITSATTRLVGYILTSVDSSYGKDDKTPGARYLADPLGENSVPMFYHNGDTARIVLQETVNEMNRRNQVDGKRSFFYDPHAFLTTMIAAAAGDLISDGERREQENRTATLTKAFINAECWGYDFSQASVVINGDEKSIPDVVENTIIASTFNEAKKVQMGGSNPISDVVNDGDLAPLFLRQSTKKSICLSVEDLWRGATSEQWEQLLREAAVDRAFVGHHIEDFLSLIDEGFEIRRPSFLAKAAGRYLILNAEFVDPDGIVHGTKIGHRYKNEQLQGLTLRQRKENADFQRNLGARVFVGDITMKEAYRQASNFRFKSL